MGILMFLWGLEPNTVLPKYFKKLPLVTYNVWKNPNTLLNLWFEPTFALTFDFILNFTWISAIF